MEPNATQVARAEDYRMNSHFVNFAIVCIITMIIVGILGNLATIVALWRCPKVRTATTAFIINLSFADLIFCLFCMPFTVSLYIHHDWLHGAVLCVIFPLVRYTNVGLSLMSIVAITVNRCVLIANPAVYCSIYNRRRYVSAMIAFIWLFCFGMMIPTLAGVWGKFGLNKRIHSCTILSVNGSSPKNFLFILGFTLPVVAIVICYLIIFVLLYRSHSRMLAHSHKKEKKTSHLRPDEKRLTAMVLLIFLTFLLCYLPVTVIKVGTLTIAIRSLLSIDIILTISCSVSWQQFHGLPPEMHVLGNLLVYLSACVNPLLYGAVNPQYRQAYRRMFTRMLNMSERTGMTSTGASKPEHTAVPKKDEFVEEKL
ncbi:hypothetical protein LAZ67_4004141 [Cordylochernes scorpioides]|uniref:G-protein coupled receptors family 1 profile domain-containing protein n=1 Tax=Cordylochernes scorpioides TaxID=51811 RepID=A0ABY6KEF1_9ARAC|nr:hypothetical protein LAZ67_4004141 [Cordylochernes scorpioides]